MISLKHKFLFVHIPKTAGNSIQNILRDYSEDKIVCLGPHQDGIERFEVRSGRFNIHKHTNLREYRAQLGEEVFQGLFKFASIRNPWDRVISYYFSPHRGKVFWDREKFIEFVKSIPPATDYLSLNGADGLGKYCFDSIDSYIRFEYLNDDFKRVCKQIGIPFQQLARHNVSTHRKYDSYYDSELVDLVRNLFLQEISYFGYEFGN